MLPLIVFAGVVAVAWRLSYWPFDRSYKYLPKYGESHKAKAVSTSGTKPAE
jgi:hypothetical protein